MTAQSRGRLHVRDLRVLDGVKVKAEWDGAYRAIEALWPPVFPAAPGVERVPHPALDGKRIKCPNSPPVYFVWKNGYACHIPDPRTFDLLFRDWDGVLEIDPDQFETFAIGEPLTPGAFMMRATGQNTVYLLTNGHKHPVASIPVMDYCGFRWPKEDEFVQPILLDFIPTGFVITYGD